MKTARDGTPRDHKWTAVDASNGSCRTRSHAGTPLSYSRTDRHPNTPKTSSLDRSDGRALFNRLSSHRCPSLARGVQATTGHLPGAAWSRREDGARGCFSTGLTSYLRRSIAPRADAGWPRAIGGRQPAVRWSALGREASARKHSEAWWGARYVVIGEGVDTASAPFPGLAKRVRFPNGSGNRVEGALGERVTLFGVPSGEGAGVAGGPPYRGQWPRVSCCIVYC